MIEVFISAKHVYIYTHMNTCMDVYARTIVLIGTNSRLLVSSIIVVLYAKLYALSNKILSNTPSIY